MDKAEEELRAAQTALAAAQAGPALAAVMGAPDPGEAFLGASLMIQRAVVDVLAVVRLCKGTRYSRTFDPGTVQIEWKAGE
jgi:hypothetical protein